MNESISSIYAEYTTEILSKRYNECRILDEALKDNKDESVYCPVTFDGFTCWNATSAGDTAQAPCPNFVVGWDGNRTAFKECLEDGTWFRHPTSNNSWTNYTTCIDYDDLVFRQNINTLYIIGYSVSLAAIIVSLTIFFYFRNLRCTRISIHIHLFLSFVLNNVMWLVWYKTVIPETDVLTRNPIWCQLLHVVIQYLMVANYVWMFCEGLHLHLALVVVFVEDKLAMKCFIVLGWVLPAVLVAVYAGVRAASPEDCTSCWMTDSNSMWILTAPVCISLVASMVFLINVVRVLLTKLHPSSARPAPLGMRKAVRATLILVPLFGLHFILIPFRPDQGSTFERAYQTFSAILVSMQGFCVACLFCFANHDVHQTMGDRFRSFTGQHFDSIGAGTNGNTQSKDVVV